MARTQASARPLTEHDEIRRWAEERNAKPAHVKRTGGGEDVGMIRLDFPGYSGEKSLEEISWDDWFEKFDERNLALLVQGETARGQKSNFNKLVSRDTVADTNGGRSSSRRARLTKSEHQERPARAKQSFFDSDVSGEIDILEGIVIEERPTASRRRHTSRARQRRPAARGRSGSARKSATARGRASRRSSRTSEGRRSKGSASNKNSRARARGAKRASGRTQRWARRRAA